MEPIKVSDMNELGHKLALEKHEARYISSDRSKEKLIEVINSKILEKADFWEIDCGSFEVEFDDPLRTGSVNKYTYWYWHEGFIAALRSFEEAGWFIKWRHPLRGLIHISLTREKSWFHRPLPKGSFK